MRSPRTRAVHASFCLRAQVIEENGHFFKVFYGMSSDTAMKKHSGGAGGVPQLGGEDGEGALPGAHRRDDPGPAGRRA